MRERAIHSNELRLANGEYANKMSLQRFALEAGLPVSPILTDSEASDFLESREFTNRTDQAAFYRLYPDNEWRVFIRGYTPHSSEMWEVDTMPTTSVPSFDYIDEYRIERFPNQVMNGTIPSYLKRNFGTTLNTSDIQFFLQKSDPGSIYCSTLALGSYEFVVAIDISHSRGVNWETRHNGKKVAFKSWHLGEVSDQIVALSRESTAVLQQAFPYRTSDFHFKHDFLLSTAKKTCTLLQSRVSSRVISDEELFLQGERIEQYLRDDMQCISIEPGDLGQLVEGSAPQTPYVLMLTNDQHSRSASSRDLNSLDLRGMAGLMLPEYLRGGLLHHDGYRIIAYALYWGLPISFSA